MEPNPTLNIKRLRKETVVHHVEPTLGEPPLQDPISPQFSNPFKDAFSSNSFPSPQESLDRDISSFTVPNTNNNDSKLRKDAKPFVPKIRDVIYEGTEEDENEKNNDLINIYTKCNWDGCNCQMRRKSRSDREVQIKLKYLQTTKIGEIEGILNPGVRWIWKDEHNPSAREKNKILSLLIDDNQKIQNQILHIAQGIHIQRLLFVDPEKRLYLLTLENGNNEISWCGPDSKDLRYRGFEKWLAKLVLTRDDVLRVLAHQKNNGDPRLQKLWKYQEDVMKWLDKIPTDFPTYSILPKDPKTSSIRFVIDSNKLLKSIQECVEKQRTGSRPDATLRDITQMLKSQSILACQTNENELKKDIYHALEAALREKGDNIGEFDTEGVGFVKKKCIISVISPLQVSLPKYSVTITVFIFFERHSRKFQHNRGFLYEAKTIKLWDMQQRYNWLQTMRRLKGACKSDLDNNIDPCPEEVCSIASDSTAHRYAQSDGNLSLFNRTNTKQNDIYARSDIQLAQHHEYLPHQKRKERRERFYSSKFQAFQGPSSPVSSYQSSQHNFVFTPSNVTEEKKRLGQTIDAGVQFPVQMTHPNSVQVLYNHLSSSNDLRRINIPPKTLSEGDINNFKSLHLKNIELPQNLRQKSVSCNLAAQVPTAQQLPPIAMPNTLPTYPLQLNPQLIQQPFLLQSSQNQNSFWGMQQHQTSPEYTRFTQLLPNPFFSHSISQYQNVQQQQQQLLSQTIINNPTAHINNTNTLGLSLLQQQQLLPQPSTPTETTTTTTTTTGETTEIILLS